MKPSGDGRMVYYFMICSSLWRCRIQVGTVYVHIISQSPQVETRKAALQSLESVNAQSPQLLHRVLRDALNVHLARASVATEEDADQVSLRRSRIASVFTALASFSDSTGMAERGELVTELIILAHHTSACKSSQSSMICQSSYLPT